MNAARSTSAARILLVEDQEDVRRLLVTALEMEGHQVDEAVNAADGLRHLERSHYDLVLSDYAMPGGTGAWMLHEATRRGLLRRSMALIITAHPDVRAVSNVEIVPKPLDLDRFLEQVRRLLATTRAERPAVSHTPERRSSANAQSRVELVLYVSSTSTASLEAARNLEALVARLHPLDVTVTVRDIEQEADAAAQDDVAFTPTLVKQRPEPRMWVLGNLRDPQVLMDLLQLCGVDPRP